MKRLLKDKKITIYEYAQIPDGYGGSTSGYTPIASPLWAYVRQTSGKEYYQAMQVDVKEEMLFAINYRDDITTALYIKYKDVFYNITRVDTFEGYKDDLKLYATTMEKQPSSSEIIE